MELAVADKYVNRNQTPSRRTIYRFLGPLCHTSCAMSQTIPLLYHQKSETIVDSGDRTVVVSCPFSITVLNVETSSR